MESGRRGGSPGVEDRDAPCRAARAAAPPLGVESRRVRWYAWSVFAVAAIAGVVLAVSGSPLPSVWPVLLLGAIVALSLNQFAFFPSEWSATAEAAVLVAAVVGFAHSAEFLGPVAVALLCGPLDIVHWRQRAFWRMAYNSGNRTIAALIAATVFHAAYTGDAAVDLVLAAGAASVVFAVVDLVLFVGFERLRGEQSLRAAVREDLFIDCLTVPLGLFGALAGYVATEVGWLAGALVLVPVPFAPELVLVRARRAFARTAASPPLRRALPIVAAAAIVVGALTLFAPLPDPAVLAGLVVLSFLAGFELRVDARGPIPPMVATLVVVAVVVGGDAALAGAVVVAVIATGTAWVLVQGREWWAPVLAAGAAAASAVVFDARPSRRRARGRDRVRARGRHPSAPDRLDRAVGLHGDRVRVRMGGDRRRGCVGVRRRRARNGCRGGVGAPPWGSRAVGPWAARHRTGAHRAVVSITSALSFGLAIAAMTRPADRTVLVPLAEAAAAGVAAMAMVGVRQWRFAPRRRAVDAALLLVCSVAILLAYPPVAGRGDGWSVAILGGALLVCAAVAWPIGRRADAAARHAARARDAETVRTR